MNTVFLIAALAVHSAVTNGVEVRWFEEMVPMRDGTRLYTCGALPPDGETRALVVTRTPYARREPQDMVAYAYGQRGALARGYAYVSQHVRGSGRSEGGRIVYVDERADGLDFLAWARTLPHYRGEIFLEGASYDASVHWSYLDAAPDDVKGAVLSVQDVNRYNIHYRNGNYKIALHGNWTIKEHKKNDRTLRRDPSAKFTDLPLKGFSERRLGERVADLEEPWEHPRPDDPWWRTPGTAGGEYRRALLDSKLPVLLVTGFYDIYTEGIFDMWRELPAARRANCALVVDAGGHGDRARDEEDGPLDWFDWCRGRTDALRRTKPGMTVWKGVWSDAWESAPELTDAPETLTLRLADGGRLSAAATACAPVAFAYDPKDPPRFNSVGCLTFGGRQAQPETGWRKDVITFTGEPFADETRIRGRMRLKLAVRSDCEDTAFYARLSVRRADDGKWYNVRDDIRTILWDRADYAPGETVTLDYVLSDLAATFAKGDVLRLEIAGASADQFLPHTNVRGPFHVQAECRVAHNAVCGGTLTIPVAAARPSPVVRLPDAVRLEPGTYGGHLQDVTRDGDFLYWAHTRTILKTDLSGKVLASVRDPDHNAGCQARDGKLYVAVCTRGGVIRPEDRGKYKLQINVYDAGDLHLIEKRVIENASDRAGSLAILPDGSFVVGCLRPPDVRADQVRFYHLSPEFEVLARHEIGDMPIRLGIEVIKYRRGDLWLFSYGGRTVRLDAATFAEKGRYDGLGGALGAVFDGDGLWCAKCDKEVGSAFDRTDKSEIVFRSSLVRTPVRVSALAAVPCPSEAKPDLTGAFPAHVKCVHLVAPSSLPPKDVIVKATNALARAGYRVKVSPGVWTYAPDGARRARYLEAAWKDPETDLILCGRGGRGGYDTVTNLDFSVLRSRDVPFVGFSNISCLMNAFVAKGVGRPISGPMCTSMVGYPTTRDSIERLSATVAGGSLEVTRLQALRPAARSVSGKPIGGHWPSISRMDRDWLPSTDGRIVFLEVNRTYSLEKAKATFLVLKGKGYFSNPAAVVLCDLGISGTEEDRRELVRFLVGELSCPVFRGYPYGHVPRCYAIDYGRTAEIAPDGVLSWREG